MRLAIALLLCVSLAAAVDSTTVSEASTTHEVELKQIERSFAQEQAWSQFIAGHHAELLEMQVSEAILIVLSIHVVITAACAFACLFSRQADTEAPATPKKKKVSLIAFSSRVVV